MLALSGTAAATDLTVTYTPVASVPLSPWVVAVLAVALGAVTVLLMRRRGMGSGLTFGVAAMIGLVALSAPNRTRAANLSLNLTGPGSNSVTLPASYSANTIVVTNTSGGTTTLTGIILPLEGPYWTVINPPPTTCSVGLTLIPNQSCLIHTYSPA